MLIGGLASTAPESIRFLLWGVAGACLLFSVVDTIRCWAAEKVYFSGVARNIGLVLRGLLSSETIVQGNLVPGQNGEPSTLHVDLRALSRAWWRRFIVTFVVVVGVLAVLMHWALPKAPNIMGAPFEIVGQAIGSAPIGSFDPPAWAQKNDDGSLRIFVHETAVSLMTRFKSFTALQAEESSKPFVGKWMAVAGTVAEVRPLGGLITVRTVEGTIPPVFINFRVSESDSLKVFNPGNRIKAVCQIGLLDYERLWLENCRVVP